MLMQEMLAVIERLDFHQAEEIYARAWGRMLVCHTQAEGIARGAIEQARTANEVESSAKEEVDEMERVLADKLEEHRGAPSTEDKQPDFGDISVAATAKFLRDVVAHDRDVPRVSPSAERTDILHLLAEDSLHGFGILPSSIAEALALTTQKVTAVLRQLVKENIVVRQECTGLYSLRPLKQLMEGSKWKVENKN